jgi:hypothetical protein
MWQYLSTYETETDLAGKHRVRVLLTNTETGEQRGEMLKFNCEPSEQEITDAIAKLVEVLNIPPEQTEQ